MNVRRCSSRTAGDKGKHLADKEVLFYVTEVATRGREFMATLLEKIPVNYAKRGHTFEIVNF
ncbi:hypothetical protein M5V91_29495 (plasmid) [Cytobacillus pseudoceanisediminis]|uniref:hypothetical protein n=1 Tax=Cytobacillus pseudoceanisediminis TaxID=3051614 RepID=UPI002188F9A4|nr:hypothetical protein [Cytobacillus pseudoceanisediminis]UQX56948.1 hypothetical protein M5V91_29495 [Cytobacillus pseudoceanisediminis]